MLVWRKTFVETVFVQIEDKFGSSASLMKLACLLERINGPLFVHRKMIVLW